MIVEKRTYWIRPGSMNEFLRLYESEGLPLQGPALGNLLGYFMTEVGELNRVIQLWGYSSFEDRQTRKAELAGRPEWKIFLGKAGPLVERQHSELLTPAPFSPIK